MDSVMEAVDNVTFNMDETGATSPSQLEEVTLDADASLYSMGLRSPILGSRGRSIKEFEEQLSGLRKENFNLKLRIYFLEERMGNNFNLDQEDAVKKNIEIMVELESLKKEVQEKQELLCQAVKAMELEEDEHRKENATKEKELKEVKTQLEGVQHQYEMLQEEVRSQVDIHDRDYFSSAMNMQEDSQEIISHLEHRISDLEDKLRVEQQNHHKQALNSPLTTTVDQLQTKLKERDEKLQEAMNKLEAKCSALMELQAKMVTFEVALEDKQREIGLLQRKLDQKLTENKDLQLSISEIRKVNEETSTRYENECKRNERNRLAITNRNVKIAELENSMEKYKTQVANLELKLETAVNEVKSNESSSRKSPKSQTRLTDGSSISVRSTSPHADYSPASKSLISKSQRLAPSPSPNSMLKSSNRLNASGDEAIETLGRSMNPEELRDELVKYKKHIVKLEADQLKACRIIQTMLETRKKNGKEIEELQRGLQKRDAMISDMRIKINDDGTLFKNTDKKTIQERVSELNLTAAAPITDTEHSEQGDDHESESDLLLEQYKQLANDLETQKQILVDTIKERDMQMEQFEQKYEELYKEYKEKENRIVDLEFEILSQHEHDNDSIGSAKEKTDSGNEKVSFWIKESEEKDREIEKLEKELAKRTYDLQGVVNKELWQKNREIERLQKYVTGVEKRDIEITNLKKEINDYENQLKVYTMRVRDFEDAKKREREAIQEQLNNSKEDRNDLLIEINDLNQHINSMAKETASLKEELRLSDALRSETQEVCWLLGKRLEELASFLDTLLKQKSVLGFLGYKQNKLIRQKIDQSLDLSKNLSLTFQMNPDQSLQQLSNISDILNMTSKNDESLQSIDASETHSETNFSIVPDNITLSYQSHLNPKNFNLNNSQSEVIRVLREQIDKLKGEIELRDNELANRMSLNSMRQQEIIEQLAELSRTPQSSLSTEEILQKLKLHHEKKLKELDNSDSESWSEPDRSVSKARIGLDDKALKPNVKTISESTEMDGKPVTRTPSKKSLNNSESRCLINQLTEQIASYEKILREKDGNLAKISLKYEQLCTKCTQLEARVTDLNKEYKDFENTYQAMEDAYTNDKERLAETQNERDSLEHTVKSLEETLRTAIDGKTVAENEIVLLKGKIENLESYKTMLTDSMDTKTKLIQNRLNELEVEKNQAQQETKIAEGKLEDSMKEITRITDKLLSIEINHAKSTATLISEAEKEVDRRIVEAKHDFEERVRAIEKDAQDEVNKIKEAAEMVAHKYENDYVQRSEMERLQSMIKELESVQDILKLSEERVKQLEVSENNFKQQLFECECMYRNKLNDMRQELDGATLHCSQLQLEKTKTEDDKAQLQVQMKQFTEREGVFETQVADLKSEFTHLKENFKRQLAAVESEKSHLEVKVSSLETLNAELQNHLIKYQCARDSNTNPNSTKSQSAPSTPTGRILDLYLSKNQYYVKQLEDMHSNCIGDAFANFQRESLNVDKEEVERMQANSSPDLGIESDQGRFSSLEAQMVSLRPLASAIELAGTMSDTLDRNQPDLSANKCNNDNCVSVAKEMHGENYLLKKKLQKSNKLLEDTLSQLAKANQRKREVEKNICKQIHKTSQVLKIAKANLDSGSDTELIRK